MGHEPRTVWTVGHGTRSRAELVGMLTGAGVATLVDVRRFPGSRRNPQFAGDALGDALEEAGIAYRHAPSLGGRRARQPGAQRFDCIRVEGFRNYAAWMGGDEFQGALAESLALPRPCFMCSETVWWRCHRRLIADLLTARGLRVRHLLSPTETRPHRLWPEGEVRAGRLFICGERVA
ncbi:MAG TPA: DUF488 domain-containing protein [Miltoncostaeaceae bacterium]|nr:DUF488 domain-containing protein [Miltoncostaeaceae bacterium]